MLPGLAQPGTPDRLRVNPQVAGDFDIAPRIAADGPHRIIRQLGLRRCLSPQGPATLIALGHVVAVIPAMEVVRRHTIPAITVVQGARLLGRQRIAVVIESDMGNPVTLDLLILVLEPGIPASYQ